MALMAITLILTGKNNVHNSCSSTEAIDGLDHSCSFCPNEEAEHEDHFTTISKTHYPGRREVISIDAYDGKKRHKAIERLKYWKQN